MQTFDLIIDQIYISRAALLYAKDTILNKLKIKAFLSLNNTNVSQYYPEQIHKVIDIQDEPGENIKQYFDECNAFIEQNQPILIYCVQGKSRSVTIIVAYLLWKYSMTVEQAIQLISAKRQININIDFLQQLKEYERELKGQKQIKSQNPKKNLKQENYLAKL